MGGGGDGGGGSGGERHLAGVHSGLWMPVSWGRHGTGSMLPSEQIANKPAAQSSVADTRIGFRQRHTSSGGDSRSRYELVATACS
jgi:hypothetical protein